MGPPKAAGAPVPKRTAVPSRPRAAYLGSDRAGTEFWLAGPHVFSGATFDAGPTRHVCALVRFNRRTRSRRRGGREVLCNGKPNTP